MDAVSANKADKLGALLKHYDTPQLDFVLALAHHLHQQRIGGNMA